MKIGDLSPLFMALDKQFFKDAGVEFNQHCALDGSMHIVLAAGRLVSLGRGIGGEGWICGLANRSLNPSLP